MKEKVLLDRQWYFLKGIDIPVFRYIIHILIMKKRRGNHNNNQCHKND